MSQLALSWNDRPDRWAERRAQFIKSNHDLDHRHTITLAYSELGYSSSGIAGRTEYTESTVSGYLDTLAEQFGVAIVWAKRPAALGIEAPLGPGGHDG